MTAAAKTVDLIIRGGTVIDGTKAPRFDADVAIQDGRIAAIGDLAGYQSREVIDAKGQIVAPGFIDSHTHDDQAVLSQSDMSFKVSQGVTTVIAGNCGISVAPLRRDMDLPMPLNLLEAPAGSRFTTFEAFLDALRATPSSVNVAAMVGHTTLRAVTMSALDRPANGQEIEAMRALVERGAGGRRDRPVHRHLLSAGRRRDHRGDHRGGAAAHRAQGAVRHAHARRGRPGDGVAGRDLPHRPRARRAGGGVAPQGAEQAQLRPLRRSPCPSSARRCGTSASAWTAIRTTPAPP